MSTTTHSQPTRRLFRSEGQVGLGRIWDQPYLGLYLLYLVIGFTARVLGWVHGDAIVYVDAARRVLDGSFDLYSVRLAPEIAPPEGITYSYSPLLAILIAPFVWLSDTLGWGQPWAERLMAVPLMLIDVLAMHQIRLLVREWKPAVDERFIFLGALATLCLTGFWVVTAFSGHHEGLMLLCIVLSVRLLPRNLLLSGLWAGLALAAKHTVLLALIPIGLVLLAGGMSARNKVGEADDRPQRRSIIHAPLAGLIWGGTALAVLAAFLLPAVLRNPGGVWYAFVTMNSRLILYGSGLPVWLDKAFQGLLSAQEYALAHESLVLYANWALIGAVLVGSAAVVWRAKFAGRPIRLQDARLLALVAFGAVTQIVLGKWVAGHHYQLPLALVLTWDLVRTAPGAQSNGSGFSHFPWIGIGAAIAFRSITPFPPTTKDALLLAFFITLALLTLPAAGRLRET